MHAFFRTPFTAIGVGLGVGFTLLAVIHTATARLEHAAAIQCRNQDWPAEKHVAMTEWCREFEATRQRFGRY